MFADTNESGRSLKRWISGKYKTSLHNATIAWTNQLNSFQPERTNIYIKLNIYSIKLINSVTRTVQVVKVFSKFDLTTI